MSENKACDSVLKKQALADVKVEENHNKRLNPEGFNASYGKINRVVHFENIKDAVKHIKNLESKLNRQEEYISFQKREIGRLQREKHRAERGSNIFEADNLEKNNKKLFSEKGRLITRNTFLSKRVHELEAKAGVSPG